MKIDVQTFTGETPRTRPHLLADNAAQFAVDCDFASGSLTGIRERADVAGIAATVRSIYVHDSSAQTKFCWPRDVVALRGPIANDKYSRMYYLDGGILYVARGDVGSGGEPSGGRRVGVPAPDAAPVLVSSSTFPLSTSGWTMKTFLEYADGTTGDERSISPSLSQQTSSLLKYTLTGFTDYSTKGATSSSSSNSTTAGIGQTGSAYGVSVLVSTGGIDGTPISQVEQFYEFATLHTYTVKSANMVTWAVWPSELAGLSSGVAQSPISIKNAAGQWIRYSEIVANGTGDTTTTTTTTTAAVKDSTLAVKWVDSSGATQAVFRLTGSATMSSGMEAYTGGLEISGTTLSISVRVKGESTYIEHRTYVYTFVNQYGEEGPPSPPLEVDVPEGGAVTIRIPTYVNSLNYVDISSARLYRSSTGTSTTGLLFHSNRALGESLVDSLSASYLGTAMDTADFYPPEVGLENIIAIDNGIFAASKGNQIFFCQNYLPYAWRPQDVVTTLHTVVGMCAAEGGFYATTYSVPYFISGVTPDAMSETKIQSIRAGVSRRSICNVGQMVVYASNDGLVVARGMNVDPSYSYQFFTRDDWRDLYKSKLYQMRLDAHDGNLLMWFTDGTPGFLIRFEGENASFTRMTDPIYASFVYPLGDALYVSSGSAICEFKGLSSRKPFIWRSKDFVVPKALNLAACRLRGNGDVRFTLYADGSSKMSKVFTLNGDSVFRLPSGYLANTWSFRLDGAKDSEVREMVVATSMEEVRNG